MEAWTTYKDIKGRLWVITQLFWEGEEIQTANVLAGCNLYRVGSNGEFQYITREEFERIVEQKLMVKI
ncbi:MAG: hypothetical protein WCU83_02720 [Bacteroidia bacterium]|jgi:hypothetical protein